MMTQLWIYCQVKKSCTRHKG